MSESEQTFQVAARSPGRKEDGRFGEPAESCRKLVAGTGESKRTDEIVDVRTDWFRCAIG